MGWGGQDAIKKRFFPLAELRRDRRVKSGDIRWAVMMLMVVVAGKNKGASKKKKSKKQLKGWVEGSIAYMVWLLTAVMCYSVAAGCWA